MRLLFANVFNTKNVRYIKLDSNNILLFDYLECKNSSLKTTENINSI